MNGQHENINLFDFQNLEATQVRKAQLPYYYILKKFSKYEKYLHQVNENNKLKKKK